jgi:hypothetical protein
MSLLTYSTKWKWRIARMASKKRTPATTNAATGVAKAPRLPVSEIPEVQKVVDLKQEIDALKADHPGVFLKLADLVDQYNTALEEASNVVRSRGVTCGPFENFSVSTKYDATKLYEEVGEELFLQCGGTKARVQQLKVDPNIVEAAIASGKIPKECVDHFRTISRSYHKPDPINIV